ncbi:response regulator [Roseococcus sp. SDR]|uniref:response regulator n=1 Tax=Roseococcus sp. SDR TaxID=2835532 RepID=UPI001BCFFF37|nr:response regulator [Roseococcus sp. SDR]MBS7788557.1 response regulator [Roseococcus sp. SDR]MBV1843871.1 response regulator [Roseococcus sp. SDR]
MTKDPVSLLLVEDEPHILREMARALARRWSPVLQASSAQEATALLATHPEIAVLVTDIRMPGENGLDLALRMLAGRGDADALEVVLISGHAMPRDLDGTAQAGGQPGGRLEFVQKPFRLAELEAAIMRAHERAVARRGAA